MLGRFRLFIGIRQPSVIVTVALLVLAPRPVFLQPPPHHAQQGGLSGGHQGGGAPPHHGHDGFDPSGRDHRPNYNPSANASHDPSYQLGRPDHQRGFQEQGGHRGGPLGGMGGQGSPGGVMGGPGGPGGGHTHTVTQSSGELELRPITEPAPSGADTLIVEHNGLRYIITNGLPNHATGQFPNRGNPNQISKQSHVYRMPLRPEVAVYTTPMRHNFGVALSGVPFDPGAAEFWEGNREWQYEPLSGAVELGIDANHAHVQPTGAYHYHGLPTGLLEALEVLPERHSPVIGWAADGFPIYARYGYSDPDDPDSTVVDLQSGYLLKTGDRAGPSDNPSGPGGTYDGTFVNDYEFVEGLGDLDECNGRFCVTPDFPKGTYAYFLTEAWPVIPRAWAGTPHPSFTQQGPERMAAMSRFEGGPSGGQMGGYGGGGPGRNGGHGGFDPSRSYQDPKQGWDGQQHPGGPPPHHRMEGGPGMEGSRHSGMGGPQGGQGGRDIPGAQFGNNGHMPPPHHGGGQEGYGGHGGQGGPNGHSVQRGGQQGGKGRR